LASTLKNNKAPFLAGPRKLSAFPNSSTGDF
jgi:hypothetical protein